MAKFRTASEAIESEIYRVASEIECLSAKKKHLEEDLAEVIAELADAQATETQLKSDKEKVKIK